MNAHTNIEKLGVVPLPRVRKGTGLTQALQDMEVGEAIAINTLFQNARACINAYRKRGGEDRKYTCRTLEDGRIGIWRTA